MQVRACWCVARNHSQVFMALFFCIKIFHCTSCPTCLYQASRRPLAGGAQIQKMHFLGGHERPIVICLLLTSLWASFLLITQEEKDISDILEAISPSPCVVNPPVNPSLASPVLCAFSQPNHTNSVLISSSHHGNFQQFAVLLLYKPISFIPFVQSPEN